ncbi:MAG: FHA domain-containing protein [Pseudolysinimonas sp.]
MSDNPFLLPPGGAKPSPHDPLGTPDAAPASRPAPASAPDPVHYIAVPASVESATHRIARPAEPPLDATVVAEETRMAPMPAPVSPILVLPDGTRVPLTGPLLLGRNPAGISDRPDALLHPVVDPGKTVSKTHALLEPAAGGVRVRELHSTNGVAVDTTGARQILTGGSEAVAPFGSTILLGSFPIGVAAG